MLSGFTNSLNPAEYVHFPLYADLQKNEIDQKISLLDHRAHTLHSNTSHPKCQNVLWVKLVYLNPFFTNEPAFKGNPMRQPALTGRLQNKTVLVTGAAAGIGAAICQRFHAEGAALFAVDLNEDGLTKIALPLHAQGLPVETMVGNLTVKEDCQKVVRLAHEKLGRIDVLCNVAGMVEGGSLLNADEESWERSIALNITATRTMCQLTLPTMLAHNQGSIINIASVAGPFAVKDRAVYSTTKAAVIGMTKSMAIDFIGAGIRVNAICPGTVDSPSWRQRVKQSPNPDQALKDFIARQPMGRVGKADEIAALAAYLAADESAYMTGQSLYIDGGMTM